jgi:transcriptional regulator with XRE-family HTH domain
MARMNTTNMGGHLLARCLGRGDTKSLAEKLGVSAATVSLYASGKRRPSGLVRAKIEALHGVPWVAWDQMIDLTLARKAES